MSCENLIIPKPLTLQCPTSLFGIPYGTAGRTVAGTTFPIDGIVLHCYDGTIAELCNEMKCRTRSSVISGSYENSFHYSIGAAASSGGFQQHVEDGNIAWTFGTYKNNTYATVPPPNIAINWPFLQGEHGINTTPDVYTINIALAIGHIVDATQSGCYTCPTASGLQQTQHEMLVHMLAFLVQEYGIPIDADHITFHDLIHCGEGQECPCTDLDTLLTEVASFCPPCEQEAIVAPEAAPDDEIQFIYGITQPCCPTSPGCAVKIPWNGCYVGDLATDGDLTSYILGLSQDPVTGQWCLTRGCLALLNPLTGCGTVDDPLGIDRCAVDDWIDSFAPLSAVERLLGIDDNGCLTLQNSDSWFDMVACNQPENNLSVPEWILAKTDNTCPEWVTPDQIVAAGLATNDTDCISLSFVGNVLTATPIISPAVGNIIECTVDGLYVPIPSVSNCTDNLLTLEPDGFCVQFDCNDLLPLYDTGINVVNLHGDDDGGACGNETLRNAWDRMFCDLFEDPLGVPVWLAGATEALECPVLVTPDSIVAAGLNVQNTDCINLDFTANVLTATPAISIDIGGVQNVLSCEVSGLYVPRGGNANVNGPLTGNGSDTNPLDIDFSALDAQDLCDLGAAIPFGVIEEIVGRDAADCLRVQAIDDVVGGVINVQDTNCISLNWVNNVLTANPILAPAQAGVLNQLQCLVDGLYIPTGAGLSVQDTNCVDLTLNNGVLSADVTVNPAGDNALTCGVGGLYVPIAANLQVLDTDCVNHTLVGGVLSTLLNLAGPQGGIPNILSCVVGQGLYVPESHINVIDTTCINLTFVDGDLQADIILDPSGDNQVTCLPSGLYVPPAAGLQVSDTNCITLNLAGDTLTASPIVAPQQGLIPNALSCVPGQGLYVPTTATDFITSVAVSDCILLDVSAGQLTAVPIIASPQGACNNILSCVAGAGGGLFVPQTQVSFVGNTPAGGNIIGIDTDCDGVNEYEFCEGFEEIVSANDCFSGGVGADYMIRDFSLVGKTLTVEGAPEHESLSINSVTGGETVVGPTGAPGTLIPLPLTDTQTIFTNPSACRDMVVDIEFTGYGGSVSVASSGGATTFSYAVQYEIFINAAPANNPFLTDHIATLSNTTFGTFESDSGTTGWKGTITLPPGGNVVVDTRARIRVALTPINVNLANTRVSADPGYLLISGRTT